MPDDNKSTIGVAASATSGAPDTGNNDLATNAMDAENTAKATVSSAELDAAIKNAGTAYISARQNAANTAATVYYIWFHACSEHATTQNKQWYDQQFTKRRDEINAWNDDLATKKKAEAADNKAKLKTLRESKRGINDPDRLSQANAQVAAQNKGSKERLLALTAQRKVKLKTRSGATDFTEITKFVLELHAPKQASQVSRYATVVKWIASEFKHEIRPDIQTIAERIIAKGGFDDVYSLQQTNDGKSGAGKKGTKQGAGEPVRDDGTRQAVVEHFRSVVTGATGLATVSLGHGHEKGSLVALIGRVGTDGVTIISEVGMPVDDVLNLCVAKQERKLLPGDPGCEFLATALALGTLVEEGTRTLKGAETVNVRRQLSMLVSDGARRLVISAVNDDVSVVVHAVPREAVIGLLPRPGFWKLDHSEVAKLTERLHDGVARKMVVLRTDKTERTVGDKLLPSEFAWESTSGPLATRGDPKATLTHPWLAMSPVETNPVDIDGFTALGTATLARAELMSLAEGHIGNWKAEKSGSKTGEKKAAIAKVTFTKSMIAIECTQGTDKVAPSGSIRGTVSLSFRPRMLANAIAMLAELATGSIELSPDDRGALRIAFEDVYGHYAIYVPCLDQTGALDKARFRKIHVPVSSDE